MKPLLARTEAGFRALQDQYGYDFAIARACGVKLSAVGNQRRALGIPPLPPPERQHTASRSDSGGVKAPLMSENQIAYLFRGRRFEDVKLRRKAP